MDKTLVFFRTAAGEAAVSQPTRIVQRHLRMVLMLVDGEHKVADVVARFGDIAVGEAALADLQRMGLIEPVDAHVRRAAAPLGPTPTSQGTGAQTAKVLPSQVTDTDPRAAKGIVETITIDDLDEDRPPQMRAQSAQADPRAPARTARPTRAARPAAERAAAVKRAPTPESPAPERSVKRRSGAQTALALMLFVVLAIVAGLRFYPYEQHVPGIEERLSAALGEPVEIGGLRVSFTPYPSIALNNVRIGAARSIAISTIRFLPDPLSLARARPAIRDLQLDGIDISGRDLERLARLLLTASSNTAVDVRELRFSDLTLRFADMVLTGIRGESAGVDATAMRFSSADEKLRGEIGTTDKGLRLRLLSLTGWAPEFLAPLAFDHFDGEGRLTQDGLRLDKVYARLADGSVSGRASVEFGADTRIRAELEMKHLSLLKLLTLSQSGVLAQGSASGTLKVAGTVSKSDAGGALVYEGSINVHNGAVQGFDLVEAVRSANRGAVRGGATRFEEFAGQVRVVGDVWRISRLRLQSGLLSADGQVSGGRDRKVAGLVNVELRGSAGSMRVPVAVTGSLKDPVLSASRGATAAAAPEPS